MRSVVYHLDCQVSIPKGRVAEAKNSAPLPSLQRKQELPTAHDKCSSIFRIQVRESLHARMRRQSAIGRLTLILPHLYLKVERQQTAVPTPIVHQKRDASPACSLWRNRSRGPCVEETKTAASESWMR